MSALDGAPQGQRHCPEAWPWCQACPGSHAAPRRRGCFMPKLPRIRPVLSPFVHGWASGHTSLPRPSASPKGSRGVCPQRPLREVQCDFLFEDRSLWNLRNALFIKAGVTFDLPSPSHPVTGSRRVCPTCQRGQGNLPGRGLLPLHTPLSGGSVPSSLG